KAAAADVELDLAHAEQRCDRDHRHEDPETRGDSRYLWASLKVISSHRDRQNANGSRQYDKRPVARRAQQQTRGRRTDMHRAGGHGSLRVNEPQVSMEHIIASRMRVRRKCAAAGICSPYSGKANPAPRGDKSDKQWERQGDSSTIPEGRPIPRL